tara:strand:+ start:567 stop:722 length:156 start_codon:yes stop_codon:yes gene_type:complete
MSDKRKYRVYVRFEEEYVDVYAKDENEAHTLGNNYFLCKAPIYTQDVEEIE